MFSQIATSRLFWIIRDSLAKYSVVGIFCIISFFLGFLSYQDRSPVHSEFERLALEKSNANLPDSPLFIPTVPEPAAPAVDYPLNSGYVYWKTVLAKVTAYTPDYRSCGRFADGRTSIGDNAWDMDGVAADPSLVPYGTLVQIPEVGFREVDDTGTAMKQSRKQGIFHFDLRMAYNWHARRWGVKWLKVKLFRKKR
jgi:3D (Asp-Asp-Asp) domain-containing protein